MHKFIPRLFAAFLFVGVLALGGAKAFASNTLVTIPPDPSTWLTTNWNAYVHLPSDYNSSPNTYYPAIIFFPGLGEVGASNHAASDAKKNGPNAYIDAGWDGTVTVDGQVTKFIVISVQPWTPYPTNMVDFKARITWLMSHYRIDPNRVNMTGLSHGAWMANMYAVFKPSANDYSMMDLVASVVNVEGAIPSDDTTQAWWSANATPAFPQRFTEFAQRGGKMLGFEQVNDGGRGIDTIASTMNAVAPGSGTYIRTNFGGGGHCCWANFYGGGGTTPSTFVINGVSQNIYQWMARQSRTGGGTGNPGTPTNAAPTANAGADKAIQLPTSSVTLSGSGSDSDGTIASYLWTKTSGGAATISSSTSASTSVTGLTQGSYTFQLKVTDDDGATATDTVNVTVAAAAANTPPVANAGPDQTIFLPATTTTLTGSATDVDGDNTIISKEWFLVGGPNATITSPTSLTTTVTGLVAGAYNFQLKVTDASYAQATDNVTITVTSSTLLSVPGTGGNWNAWVKLPAGYNLSANATKRYPVIIFFPGITETGTNAAFLKSYGPIAYAESGWDGTATVDGQTTDFIVVAMQTGASNWPVAPNIKSHIQYILDNYRVDLSRVNLMGISHGGWVSNSVATYKPSANDYSYVDMAASVVDLAGVAPGSPYPSRFTAFAQRGGKELGIEQVGDPRDIATIINTMNAAATGSAVYISQDTGTPGHCCWALTFGDATHVPAVFTIPVNGVNKQLNVYQWAALQQRGGTVNPPVNAAPTANAGADKTIQLPTSSVSLTGSASDSDGSITSYAWTKVSGGTATIASSSSATTNITGLVQGTYVFRLTVTDNGGLTASDDVTVTVNAAPVTDVCPNMEGVQVAIPSGYQLDASGNCVPIPNSAPSVNAGVDQTITLPTSSVSLTGSASDSDGSIASYTWTKVSGTGGTITTSSAATTTVTGLTAGSYTFRLTVTDNGGLTASDDVNVTVNTAPTQGPSRTIRVDFGNAGATTSAAGWNNMTNASLNSSISLIDTTGASAGMTARVTDAFYTNSSLPNNSGNETGTTSSTLYPASATRDSWYVSPWSSPADSFGKVAFSGLSTSATYTVKAYASRMGSDGVNRTAIYTAGGVSKELNATDNVNTVLTFDSLTSTDGTLSVSIAPKPGVSNYAYLGVVELIENGSGTVNPPTNIPPTVNAGANKTITLPTSSVSLTGSASDSDGSIASYTWTKVSGTGGTITTSSAATTTVTGLTAGSYTFRLTVTDNSGATAADEVVVTVNAAAPTLISAGKTVTTSSIENSSLVGSAAVDGNTSTRWSSAFSDPQWMYVDLGATYNVSRVKINWETAYGKDYLVQVSSDATSWTTLKTVTGNTSTTTDYTGLSGTGRYVRIYGTARATQWGYSIWELEVYGVQQ